MKNKKLRKIYWVFVFCLLPTIYCLLSISGCGLNNPFTPPKPRGPTLLRPSDGDTLDAVKITFNWDIVPDREIYQFQISKLSKFTSFVIDTNDLVDSRYEYDFSGSDTCEYFWRVKVKYKTYQIWSEWSDVWSFVICPGTGNNPPVTPYNPSPADSALDISVNPILSWMSGDPDGDVVTYTIYFGKDSTFPDPPFTVVDASGAPLTTVLYELTNSLDYGEKYYWKVEAQDNFAMSAGPIWRFTTSLVPNDPPNTPLTPTGPSVVYADDECTFTTSTTDPEGDSVSYLFNFGDEVQSDWTPLVPSGNSGSASHIYTKQGTFYVKARAKDKPGSLSGWSDSMSVLVKANAGACWVADNGDEKVVKLSAKGSRLCEVGAGGIWSLSPLTLEADPQTGWCWEASTYMNRTHRISPDCDTVKEHLFIDANPSTPCVDGFGYCWYVFSWTKKLVKLNENWNIAHTIDDNLGQWILLFAIAIDLEEQALWVAENDQLGGQGQISRFLCSGTIPQFRKTGFKAGRLDVDQTTHCCWVPDCGNNRVVKISSDGDSLEIFGGFNQPSCVSVDSYTHCCWVADYGNKRVVKLSEDGTEICEKTGFVEPFAVEADPIDHGCWVSDKGAGKVIKLDANCDTLFTLSDFVVPTGLSVNPNPDP